MSNDNAGEKPARRKPKVSCATLIGAGLVGPKARQKCVVDGNRLIFLYRYYCDGVTEKANQQGVGFPV